jgi:carboxylesterase type B
LDWDKADFDLASSISKYWTSFAKTGNPNTPQQENWPAFDAVNYNTQIFDTPISTVQGIRKEKLDLMARATAKH